MNKFVYVYTSAARQILEDNGFVLMKADYKNDIYVFVNDQDKQAVLEMVSYILSDTLTF